MMTSATSGRLRKTGRVSLRKAHRRMVGIAIVRKAAGASASGAEAAGSGIIKYF
jgi:hypothetical protein